MVDNTWCESWGSECPYCGNQQNYTGDPLGQDETTIIKCSKCEKEYEILCHVLYRHEGRPIEDEEEH